MQALISQLGQTFAKARSLEELTRPLLEMLQKVTNLESTYLTRIDLGQPSVHGRYHRRFAEMRRVADMGHDDRERRWNFPLHPFERRFGQHVGERAAHQQQGFRGGRTVQRP